MGNISSLRNLPLAILGASIFGASCARLGPFRPRRFHGAPDWRLLSYDTDTCDYPGNITHGRVLLVGHMGKYEYRQYEYEYEYEYMYEYEYEYEYMYEYEYEYKYEYEYEYEYMYEYEYRQYEYE